MGHVASIFTDTGLSLFLNNKSYAINDDHPHFEDIKQALRDKDYSRIEGLIDVAGSIKTYVEAVPEAEGVSVADGIITVDGYDFPPEVSAKVLRMIREGAPADPIYRHLRKIMQNPRPAARREFLLFAVANDFLIAEDGDFLAYRSVRADYKDKYTGTIDNSVGQVVEIPRDEVDDRRDVTCSFGLHFASYNYAATQYGQGAHSGDHVMVVKINPKDVVAIPSDYNNQKGRCCRYEVIAERTDYQPLPHREVYDSGLDFGAPASDNDSWGCGGGHAVATAKKAAPTESEIADRVKAVAANVLQNSAVLAESIFSTLFELDFNKSTIRQFFVALEGEFAEFEISLNPEAFNGQDDLDNVVTAVRREIENFLDGNDREEEEDEFTFDDEEEDDEDSLLAE